MQKLPTTHKSRGCCAKCILGTFIYILVLLLLLFIIVFVIVPIVFKYSIGIQRNIIFPSWVITPINYSDVEASGIKGVKNFYLTLDGGANTTSDSNVTLGVWQILPYEILSDLIDNEDYNYEGALTNENYNILLYLHGNGADRAAALELYDILRKYFHIFAVDYRGYGDSSMAEMTESHIVTDMVEFYKWLRSKTNSKIYVWGHSLGTGVGTHLLASLKKDNIYSKGLILETPFTSITDVMLTHPIIKVFSFLPWFRTTMIEPIIYNDLNFESKKHILDVDCPVMILHAKDDTVIPYSFATELYNTAVNNRNESYQGNITYHLFESLGYDHMFLYRAPELPTYVRDFMDDCNRYEKEHI
ncbi:lysophosphatidylserine lipase ABHD12 [Leptinotarsa decemlineata]|uniref:lysophosphatidylserine lipase ABHD12 n=1 Tax=Leptinotarsa decemlineata TaxID=7539 RepID=UPI000C25436A|nr:monoacylglycerol lipase ABHD12-like [Leptinotarsa decemlineata]